MMPIDLERFRAGDEAMFDELVRTYSPLLVIYLRRYAGAEADVDDLLQEVWLRTYRKRATYSGSGSFVGWLLAVGRTIGMDAVRKRHRFAEPIPPLPSERSCALETLSLGRTLTDAVLALADRQRDVVLMRLVEGFSTAETAARLHCAEGTVKATLYQAVIKLRALLRKE